MSGLSLLSLGTLLQYVKRFCRVVGLCSRHRLILLSAACEGAQDRRGSSSHRYLKLRCNGLQTVEEGIKPGHKAAKDALKQTKDAIPEPEEARKQARDYAGNAAESTAKAVKDNARPTADRIEKEAIRPAQGVAEALPGQVKVRGLSVISWHPSLLTWQWACSFRGNVMQLGC